MSFLDLYMNRNPLITGSDEGGDPVATIFGVPLMLHILTNLVVGLGLMLYVIPLITFKFFILNLVLIWNQ